MNNNIYAVIMAGGRGERFWPKSRNARPKQLQKLLGERTMLEMTASRLQPLVPPERILVITNRDYAGQIRSALPEVPPENIIGEPAARDTGPCVALAAALVAARGGADAVMLTLPADHAIEQAEQLRAVLKDAAELAAARPGWLFTIGVNPTEPATGYGYIHCGEVLETGTGTRFFRGLGFKEKPDAATAERFLAAGCYRWNSGMFIWQVRSLMQAFERYAPQLAGLFRDVLEMERRGALETELPERFVKEPRISIDYAVMEKAENVGVAECRFDWDDLGSWPALRNHLKPDSDGNLADGLFAGVDCRNLIVSGRPGHLVAAIGVEDLVIVETEDATLVCRADQAQRIKELLKLAESRPELRKFL